MSICVNARFGARVAALKAASGVVPGLAVLWNIGGSGFGQLYFAAAPGSSVAVFPGEIGYLTDMARDGAGGLHLVFTDRQSPTRIRYAWRP